MIGLDGRPVQKSLRQMLQEWVDFRQTTITRRSTHRLEKVQARIHILEGRQIVLLNIDEVIAIIRESDEPKAALIARFDLSDRQAEDILEIRLRQLARLEAIKIEKELNELREEEGKLQDILDNPKSLQRLMIKEIEADAKTFADERRTLIQEEKKVTAEIKVPDEPVTVIVSDKGWVRTHKGHGHEAGNFSFKAGDQLWGTFECRTVDQLIVFGTNGRVYSVPVATLPGGRGDGQPINTLIDLEAGSKIASYFAGPVSAQLLISGSGGYGFIAKVEAMCARNKGGKGFVTIQDGETLCQPSVIGGTNGSVELPDATHVACLTASGNVLTYALSELKLMTGGRGLQLMKVEDQDALVGAAAYTRSVRITGVGRGGKEREESLEIRSLNAALGKRGAKGKTTGWTFKPTGIFRVE
jgi:topoisomerase-4 subunit A